MLRKLIVPTTLILTALSGTAALADCKPSCSSGETCRYNGNNGKFYCEANNFKGSGKELTKDRIEGLRDTIKVERPGAFNK